MRQPSPLPRRLTTGPFSVSSGLSAGISKDRLGGSDLAAPFRGVRVHLRPGDDLKVMAEHYAPLLRPGDRFSHATAAHLWGAPLPGRLEGNIHVTAAPGLSQPRSAGVIGYRSRSTTTARIVTRSGLPVSDPATCFRELASLMTLPELIAVGDYLVLDPRQLDPADLRPHVHLKALRDELRFGSGRGVRVAREAAALVRPGVESPMETRLRLLLMNAGIPEPICGYELVDLRGSRIGWFDLAWPDYRVIAEYDGDGHRTSTHQYERDIDRFDRAADIDWRVIRVRRHGVLADPTRTVNRVSSALVRAGWTPSAL